MRGILKIKQLQGDSRGEGQQNERLLCTLLFVSILPVITSYSFSSYIVHSALKCTYRNTARLYSLRGVTAVLQLCDKLTVNKGRIQ